MSNLKTGLFNHKFYEFHIGDYIKLEGSTKDYLLLELNGHVCMVDDDFNCVPIKFHLDSGDNEWEIFGSIFKERDLELKEIYNDRIK